MASIFRTWIVLFALACIVAPFVVEGAARRRPGNRHQQKKDPDDYYQILGIKKSATSKDVKASYRKLALKYHPDKVAEDQKEASEKVFMRVSEAYAILSDDKKRKVYDKHGKQGLEMLEKGMDPDEQGGFGGFPGGGGGQFHHGGQGGFDPFSMFEDMFGGAGGGGGQQQFHGGGFPGGGGGRQQAPPDLFPKGQSKVSKLGQPKFPNKSSKHLWLIMFYHPQDPACQESAEDLEIVAAKSAFKVGAVDCSHPRESEFCTNKLSGKDGYPQFVFVIDGKVTLHENPAHVNAKGLHEFVVENIPKTLVQNINHKLQLSDRMLSPALKDKNAAAVLLLSDKYETSTLYFSLAYQFRSSFDFGESRAKNLDLAKEFSVKKYPLLIAFVPKGSGDEPFNEDYDIVRYQGSVKQDPVTKWLTNTAKRIRSRARASTGL